MTRLNSFLCAACACFAFTPAALAQRYVGGDISLLPEYENAGSKYYSHDGAPIADFIPWCHEQGMNAMRVRLFVDPDGHATLHPSSHDPNACQDLDYIIPLCQKIVDSGLALMLDFHYSDTWADPAAQWTPDAWKNLSDSELVDKIHDYTYDCLTTLKGAGVVPVFIQPGNEISYGMLWGPEGTSSPKKVLMGNDANWARLGDLLNSAIDACREVCPDAKIVIHTERAAQVNVQNYFYDKMKTLGVDYDIIGLSYYPAYHGDLTVLSTALASLQSRYPEKKIMIVETGYGLKWDIPNASHDFSGKWPLSDAGQNKFAADLVATLEGYDHVDGLFWWWMEYNPYGSNLSGWYNAPLFDPFTGRATSAFTTLCSFADSSAVDMLPADGTEDDVWYTLSGMPVKHPSAKGIYIKSRKSSGNKFLTK